MHGVGKGLRIALQKGETGTKRTKQSYSNNSETITPKPASILLKVGFSWASVKAFATGSSQPSEWISSAHTGARALRLTPLKTEATVLCQTRSLSAKCSRHDPSPTMLPTCLHTHVLLIERAMAEILTPASATQPLWSEWLDQPLSHSATQPLSHSATQPVWVTEWLSGCSSHSARVAEWLSGWARVATLTRAAEESLSIHMQLKPRKVFRYTHCLWHDMAASEFVLAASDSLFFAGFVSRWCYLLLYFINTTSSQ